MSRALWLMDSEGFHVIVCIPEKVFGKANCHAGEVNELRSSEIDEIWKVFNVLLLKDMKKACGPGIGEISIRISLNGLEPVLKRWDGVCWRGIPLWRWAGRCSWWAVWLWRSSEWPSLRLEVTHHHETKHLLHPLWRLGLLRYCHFRRSLLCVILGLGCTFNVEFIWNISYCRNPISLYNKKMSK